MRIKLLPAILLLALLLTACSSTGSEPPQTSVSADTAVTASIWETTSQPESETENTELPKPETKDVVPPIINPKGTESSVSEMQSAVPATDIQLPDYQEIYAQTVTESTNENALYSLIYLDDDDIPELMAYDSYYLTYSIYTVKDDALFCLADALDTVELTYYERTGILCEFARWNGGGDEGGYGRHYYRIDHGHTLTDDDTPILNYVYNAVYDENDVYTGEGITEYFSMGEETDEASYERLTESLGITENDERACSENALEKEEMLTFLSK